MSTFVKGSVLLIVAAFISECLEFVVNMVLARELGAEGLGRYMAILPTILFLVVIASMELPVSISKLVAEQEQTYHSSVLQHTLRFTLFFTSVFLVVSLIILPLIPIFQDYHPLLRWLLLLLIPIISLSSIARGYFMGVQHMGKIALSNMLRRTVQLILLIMVYQAFHFDTGLAILVALSTLIATELVVFMYLIISYFFEWKKIKKRPSKPVGKRTVLQALISVSLPTTGLRIFHAAAFAVKPFLIKETLVLAGVVEDLAMVQYGKLAGVAFSIGFFPAFIAHSLLIVLIPTVSELYAQKDMLQLQRLLRRIMLFTLLYALPAAAIFYYFSNQLTSLFFDASSASGYLQLLIPYFFFHYFAIPLQAFLIGLGLVKDAFIHALWATTISFVLMFALGSTPLQMDGIIMGMNYSAVLLFFMHYVTIRTKLAQPQIWKFSEAH